MTPAMLFDLAGIKLNGPSAWDKHLTTNWTITAGQDQEADTTYAVQLRNGVLVHTSDRQLDSPDITLTSTQQALAQLVLGSTTVKQLSDTDELSITVGAVADVAKLFALLEPFKFWFNIVTP